jgi:hypothetical protein
MTSTYRFWPLIVDTKSSNSLVHNHGLESEASEVGKDTVPSSSMLARYIRALIQPINSLSIRHVPKEPSFEYELLA